MELILFIGLIFITIEFLFYLLFIYLKKDFKWLISYKDEFPIFKKIDVDKFLNSSFDKDLGWIRKKNTKGIEKSYKNVSQFNIDKYGARSNKFNYRAKIAIFGDSYSFCRQVNDNETWPSLLANKFKFGAINFGVGNYGLDQALLRYEKTKLHKKTKIVIIGVVPETISRIHSYWKHYLEFGNILGFKPIFELKSKKLILTKPAIQSKEDFNKINKIIKELREKDFFYHTKFKKFKFTFPYIFSFSKNIRRNCIIIICLILNKILKRLNKSDYFFNLAFFQIMKNNILESHNLYKKKECNNLLISIIQRFKKVSEKRGHIPILVIMPQLLDLKFKNNKKYDYELLYSRLKKELHVLDLTSVIYKKKYEKFYLEDKYGGHFSPIGNEFVFKNIYNFLLKKRLI